MITAAPKLLLTTKRFSAHFMHKWFEHMWNSCRFLHEHFFFFFLSFHHHDTYVASSSPIEDASNTRCVASKLAIELNGTKHLSYTELATAYLMRSMAMNWTFLLEETRMHLVISIRRTLFHFFWKCIAILMKDKAQIKHHFKIIVVKGLKLFEKWIILFETFES